MDKRSKNRLREHSQPGHELSAVIERDSVECLDNQPGTLFNCKCEWVGWIATK